jgi:uncharacterized protein (TIGR02246 family)
MARFAPFRRTLPVLVLAAAAACATGHPASVPANPSDDARQITAELQESTVAWNRGDLEAFLHPYAPNATFMGEDVVRGYDAIRAFYRGSWFRTGAPTVNLAYHSIEVRPLGPNHALSLGKWVVTNKTTGQEARHGQFSLTWERTPAGWRIIHDHSG